MTSSLLPRSFSNRQMRRSGDCPVFIWPSPRSRRRSSATSRGRLSRATRQGRSPDRSARPQSPTTGWEQACRPRRDDPFPRTQWPPVGPSGHRSRRRDGRAHCCGRGTVARRSKLDRRTQLIQVVVVAAGREGAPPAENKLSLCPRSAGRNSLSLWRSPEVRERVVTDEVNRRAAEMAAVRLEEDRRAAENREGRRQRQAEEHVAREWNVTRFVVISACSSNGQCAKASHRIPGCPEGGSWQPRWSGGTHPLRELRVGTSVGSSSHEVEGLFE